MMQKHLEISSKYHFWTRNVRNLTKSRDLDMSGLAKTCPAGQVVPANQRKYFYFFRFYTFPFFMNKFIIFFIKSYVFISKFIIFYKIRNSVSGPPKIFLIGSTRGVPTLQLRKLQLFKRRPIE